MCGRYALSDDQEARIERALDAVWRAPRPHGRYNIAPTQHAPVVLEEEGGRRVIDLFRWGLIPRWAADPAIGNKLINARAETADEKPSFRAAFRSRRCLVPASGFYEWQKTPAGKQPQYIHPREGLLTFAGLWEAWRPDAEAEPIYSYTILTTAANRFMHQIHDRMPVILNGEARGAWLSADTPVPDLKALLRPAPEDDLEAYPVSRWVNSPAHDDASCILPLT